MRRKEEFEFLAADPGVALRVEARASQAVARVEAQVACDKLDAGQLAVAAGIWMAGRALREICGRVLHPTLSVRAELAWGFEAEVLTFVSSHLRFPSEPLSPAAETNQLRREAKGKADFRDALLACVDLLLNHYDVEALQGFNESRSVRTGLVSAGD